LRLRAGGATRATYASSLLHNAARTLVACASHAEPRPLNSLTREQSPAERARRAANAAAPAPRRESLAARSLANMYMRNWGALTKAKGIDVRSGTRTCERVRSICGAAHCPRLAEAPWQQQLRGFRHDGCPRREPNGDAWRSSERSQRRACKQSTPHYVGRPAGSIPPITCMFPEAPRGRAGRVSAHTATASAAPIHPAGRGGAACLHRPHRIWKERLRAA